MTADSTESSTEKAHLLLNTHGDGKYGSVPGSLQLSACVHSSQWKQHRLHSLKKQSVLGLSDADGITTLFIEHLNNNNNNILGVTICVVKR